MEINDHPRDEPAILWWGPLLIRVSFFCLMVGSLGVKVFFPQRVGGGLDAAAWAIMVPIWAIGIAGIVLALCGWILYPARDADFDACLIELHQPAHTPIFGRPTKWLAILAAVLLLLASLSFLAPSNDPNPPVVKMLVGYCVAAYCGLTIYLAAYYNRVRHLATNTYLNRFTPLVAFLLIPLTWPLMILLNRAVCGRTDETFDQGSEPYGEE